MSAKVQDSLTSPPEAPSVSHLELERARHQRDVNAFLEAYHPRGPVPGWKACWTASYKGYITACIIVSRPTSRHLDDGSVLEISRLGLRPDRPDNTGSWIIGNVRPWVRLEGYDEFIAYAGVAGNFGTVYSAAGFECESVTQATGKGWTNRDDRDEWDDYERRKWVYNV